ncbi:MAG: DUF4960 domain-containing protein [Salinivirgaceae bacterium]
MKNNFFLTKKMLVLSIFAIALFSSCKEDDKVTPGDAYVITFKIGDVQATIDETAHTITAALAAGTDLTALTPEIIISAGATISPASGAAVNLTNPLVYTVTDKSGTKTNDYTVTVTSATLRKIAFIGQAAENTEAAWTAAKGTDYDLNDDRAAAEWCELNMNSSTSEVTYLSFKQVADGADLTPYHVIWIQFDGGTWGGVVAGFPNNGEGKHCLLNENGVGWDVTCDDLITNFVNAVKGYYNAGGNIFFGNYAGAMVDEIGVVSKADYAPNNSWGGLSVDEGATSGAWDVRWAASVNSPLFVGITLGGGCSAPSFIMLSTGTLKKNRSNQYNLDFGPWAPNGDADPLETRLASFIQMTGANVLISNCGGNEVQMLEYTATGANGTVISALSGTYDWYTGVDGSGNTLNIAGNIETLTRNSLNYLIDLKLEGK